MIYLLLRNKYKPETVQAVSLSEIYFIQMTIGWFFFAKCILLYKLLPTQDKIETLSQNQISYISASWHFVITSTIYCSVLFVSRKAQTTKLFSLKP